METLFYELSSKLSDNQDFKFEQLKGKIVLIVNIATKCGFTPQLEGLEDLYKKYKDKGLEILGFPSDQFMHQNPESDADTSSFCQLNFGVTFPIMQKCEVNGSNASPIFQYLKKVLSGTFGNKIKWNFTKFLIDQNGKPIKRFAPVTKPEKLEDYIKNLLVL
ncbi:glutathione peroxidase [Rhizosphaericola mali]|uniref:Glutathione peroxidase n=1 Tax=Rhizosphaericola mali TaxID=2545455 RepID=A0A5P2GAS5_9BACT|nr:glutathione peroxidase [Rhizosphaericola mali]QES88661.1 glutathione peroxidase [Rhizosphaericola mali]